jgi:hypothetical protein
MIAITTSNSIKVNPNDLARLDRLDSMAFGLLENKTDEIRTRDQASLNRLRLSCQVYVRLPGNPGRNHDDVGIEID